VIGAEFTQIPVTPPVVTPQPAPSQSGGSTPIVRNDREDAFNGLPTPLPKKPDTNPIPTPAPKPSASTTVCTPSTPFYDTKSHWGAAYIEQARILCIISGKRAGYFAPNDAVTRAELTKIAILAFGKTLLTEVTTKPFPDVDLRQWFAIVVATAKAENVINGYGDGTFKPNAFVNRAEALKIILNAASINTKGMETGGRFIDTSATAWYAQYIGYAKAHSIISGYIINGQAYFRPIQNITRAEAVKILMGLYSTSSQKQ